MISTICVGAGTYFVVTLFGYVVHRAIHRDDAARFNRSHMTHHEKLYPVSDYYSDSYRSAGKDTTFLTFAVASIPLLLCPAIAYKLSLLTGAQAIFVTIEALAVGFAHDYLHDAFHIRNHFLSKFNWFQKMNGRHFRHHENMQSNFGIFSFFWDRIFGTLDDKRD